MGAQDVLLGCDVAGNQRHLRSGEYADSHEAGGAGKEAGSSIVCQGARGAAQSHLRSGVRAAGRDADDGGHR